MSQGQLGVLARWPIKGQMMVEQKETASGKCAVCAFDTTRVREQVEHLKRVLGTIELELMVPVQDDPNPDACCSLSAAEISSDLLAHRANLLRNWRHLRSEKLTARVSNGPAWNLLMEVYADCLQGKTVYLSSLAASSGMPLSTVSRHVDALEQAGLIQLSTDLVDRRRCIVRLTERGDTCMSECLMALPLQDH